MRKKGKKKSTIYSKFKRYHELMRHLKENLPVKHKVVVRRMPLPEGTDGDCCFWKGKFIVRISNRLSEELAMETMIHEYGHCLSFHNKGDDHGPYWGKAYSVVYREFLNWNAKD